MAKNSLQYKNLATEILNVAIKDYTYSVRENKPQNAFIRDKYRTPAQEQKSIIDFITGEWGDVICGLADIDKSCVLSYLKNIKAYGSKKGVIYVD